MWTPWHLDAPTWNTLTCRKPKYHTKYSPAWHRGGDIQWGPILARTTSQATQIILRLRPIRKKRWVCDPHQINAQDGTLAHRPLPFRTHRCNVQKDHSQNAEHNVPQTPDQSESFRYPGPINLWPREKIQEQHQTLQLGTQKQTLVNHKYVFRFFTSL